MLNAVTVADNPIKYTVYGDKVFSNVSSGDTVIADYIFRAGEEDWPSYFVIAVEYILASIFATSIARDANLAAILEQKANVFMRKARSTDSQQSTTRKLTTSRFLTERRS